MAIAQRRKSSNGGRYYTWRAPDGSKTERYWSVTTLIGGGVPKPALIGWAAKMTALAAIKNVDKVVTLLEGEEIEFDEAGKPTTPGANAAYKLLTEARFQKSQAAADLGTEIHEAIEAWVLDKPMPKWRPEVEPYMEQATDFLLHFEPLVEMTEASVYNRTQKYAGTLDMIATIGDERWLIDFKTGSGVYPEAALQMAAYARAEFIGRPDESEEPMPKIDHAAVVHLQPTHYEFIPVSIDDDVFNAFLYCREVFRWMEDISKRCIEKPVPSLDRLKERAPA